MQLIKQFYDIIFLFINYQSFFKLYLLLILFIINNK